MTIPSEILQEWGVKNHVHTNDAVEAVLANGVLMLIPKKRRSVKRDILSFAGVLAKGLGRYTPEEIENSLQNIRDSGSR